ncbi:MAG: glycosyltransferase family 2 protein [Acidimicrobiales bacterium]
MSIVVPTKNSEKYLQCCLKSIRAQSYLNIELIVVDNHSIDGTEKIARQYVDKFLIAGPERSAQVNIGARAASGEFIYRVDSDFYLERDVVAECMRLVALGSDAIVVHNSPDVNAGLLSKIRHFEVSMYKYDLTYSSARFIRRTTFLAMGGLDEELTAGEDFDFQNRLNRTEIEVAFAEAEAIHLGEPTSLLPLLKKYYWYGGEFRKFKRKNASESKTQLAFFRNIYFHHWREFILHPALGFLFILYHNAKFIAGGTGYVMSYRRRTR